MMQPGAMLASSNPLDHVVAHELFRIGPVAVNNHMLMAALAAGAMLVVFPAIFSRQRLVPAGVRNFFESICVYLREEVARPVLRDETDRFVGYLWTTFFFILFCNLAGMVPLAGLVQMATLGYVEHIGGTATANIWVTGALAACTFFVIHGAGVADKIRVEQGKGRALPIALVLGFFKYWRGLVPHVPGLAGALLFPLLFVLEFMGTVVKCVALAIRLFANMVAGHTLLAVLLFFIGMAKSLTMGVFVAGISVLGCVAISCLELFVAFLQAFIFTFLATVFIGMAVHQEH